MGLGFGFFHRTQVVHRSNSILLLHLPWRPNPSVDMTLMTRSRTAVTKDDIPGLATALSGAPGEDMLAGRSLSRPETPSRSRHTTNTTVFRRPLRQSDTANIPDAEYDFSFSRLSGKPKKPRRSAPYAAERRAVNIRDALSNDQRRRIKTWKDIARKKQTRDKQPTTEQQRLVMVMVFNEITPYPPEDWLSLIGGLINRFVFF